jgi:hypothetical protein
VSIFRETPFALGFQTLELNSFHNNTPTEDGIKDPRYRWMPLIPKLLRRYRTGE